MGEKSHNLEGMDKFFREGLSKTDKKMNTWMIYYLLKKLGPFFNSVSQRKYQILKSSPVYYFKYLKKYSNLIFFIWKSGTFSDPLKDQHGLIPKSVKENTKYNRKFQKNISHKDIKISHNFMSNHYQVGFLFQAKIVKLLYWVYMMRGKKYFFNRSRKTTWQKSAPLHDKIS